MLLNLERKGLLWKVYVETENGILFQAYAFTKDRAIKKLYKHLGIAYDGYEADGK